MLFNNFCQLGPITHIDWIEKVVPVFGKILITHTDIGIKTKPSCSTNAKFIMGCAGLFVISITIKKLKYATDIEKKEPSDNKVNNGHISKEKESQKKNVFSDKEEEIEKKENYIDEVNTFNLLQEKQIDIDHKVSPSFKTDTFENQMMIIEPQIAVLLDNTLKEKIEVSFQYETVSVCSSQDYSVQLENKSSKKKEYEFDRIEHSKREWCYYQEFELEDIEWIRKIKTFKITKVFSPASIYEN